MKYGIDMTWLDFLDDPGAMDLLKKYLPFMETIAGTSPAAQHISVRSAASYAPDAFPAEALERLDEELKAYGKRKGPSEKDRRRMALYRSLADMGKASRMQGTRPIQQPRRQIAPGQIWTDTEGKRIQAHGGALFFEDETYYWYGENKEFTDGTGDVWTWGVRAYRSKDLCNWEDLGLIIQPVLDDPASNLYPAACLDRPHIVRSKSTGKYVAWLKISGAESCFVVLQADAFLGPYTVVADHVRPFGYDVGDFDIVQDEESEKTYLFMDASHRAVVGFELSGDCLSAVREVSSQYEGLMPPFCREGIALFAWGGKKYMLTSGTTGYTPNQSDLAVSDSWEKPFTSIGDPYVNDDSFASFNSQVTQVFKIPGKEGCYIVLADRWMPKQPVTGELALMFRRCVASRFSPEQYHATAEERAAFYSRPDLDKLDTANSDYVWLPLRFSEGKPQIEWTDFWTPADML